MGINTPLVMSQLQTTFFGLIKGIRIVQPEQILRYATCLSVSSSRAPKPKILAPPTSTNEKPSAVRYNIFVGMRRTDDGRDDRCHSRDGFYAPPKTFMTRRLSDASRATRRRLYYSN